MQHVAHMVGIKSWYYYAYMDNHYFIVAENKHETWVAIPKYENNPHSFIVCDSI